MGFKIQHRVRVPRDVQKVMKRRRGAKSFFKGVGKAIWKGANVPGVTTALGMAGPKGKIAAMGLRAVQTIGKPIAKLAKSRKSLRLARQGTREDRREQ